MTRGGACGSGTRAGACRGRSRTSTSPMRPTRTAAPTSHHQAGAPPPTRTLERVETELGWEVVQIYGLTETSPLLTMNRRRSELDDSCQGAGS